LPYKDATASKPLTVEKIYLSTEVSPVSPWIGGSPMTVKGYLRKDSTPFAGQTIKFDMQSSTDSVTLGTATTGADGYATLTVNTPLVFMCQTGVLIGSTHVESGTVGSTVVGRVAYPTYLTITAPDKVAYGVPFTIAGDLTYLSKNNLRLGLAGKTVSLYYNGTKIADLTTDVNGGYSKTTSIVTAGTYTLKAVYAGEGLTTASIRTLSVEGLRSPAVMTALPVAAGLLAVFASLRRR
jgi:hypothetical protein